MGVFPVAGLDRYAIGSPWFERVEVDTRGGRVVVRAPGTSETAMYVTDATLDGEPLAGSTLSHEDLIGELVLTMGEAP
jgi:putative alpha-1,2-mannosidase